MRSRTALGIAAGMALTMAGGVSALFLTIGPVNSSSADTVDTNGETSTADATDGVVVEYVDQDGNPIDPSNLGSSSSSDRDYDDDHERHEYEEYEDDHEEHEHEDHHEDHEHEEHDDD